MKSASPVTICDDQDYQDGRINQIRKDAPKNPEHPKIQSIPIQTIAPPYPEKIVIVEEVTQPKGE